MSEPIIELRNVDRNFQVGKRVVRVLQDITLGVMPGEVVCLVGESGCGKTTTGKILAGLLPPSSGRVLFSGREVTTFKGEDFKRYRRAVQVIHQDPYASLNPSQTVYNTLKYPLFRHGFVRTRTQARIRVAELLDIVDLTPVGDFIDKYPHQLSGGQRQRVSIARALTTLPTVIVADEAVSMVDVSIRISLLNTLQEMRDKLEVTLVFITHDLALARYFARTGRIAVMYLGRIVEAGPTEQITHNPQHPYTRALLSAVPEADPDLARTKKHIALRSEDIPSLFALPPGCAFHPRCPWFIEGLCDATVPHLEPLPGNHVSTSCLRLQAGETLQ